MEDEEIVDTMELAEEDAKGGDGNEWILRRDC